MRCSSRVFATGLGLAALLLVGCGGQQAAPVAAAPPEPEPPAAGVVGVTVGRGLSQEDKETAIAAQQEAVSTGQRKSWKGTHGAYGFITPGTEVDGCRDYAHRIFINGRPQEGKGQACKRGDAWRVTS